MGIVGGAFHWPAVLLVALANPVPLPPLSSPFAHLLTARCPLPVPPTPWPIHSDSVIPSGTLNVQKTPNHSSVYDQHMSVSRRDGVCCRWALRFACHPAFYHETD